MRFEPVRARCAAAVADGTVPGLVLLAASGGEVRFHGAFGARQLVPRALPVLPDTLYDVASLTKAVATSLLAMRAVAAGRLALDAPVAALLPEFAGPDLAKDPRRGEVTVRHLLCHASGLPAHRPFWRQVADAPSGRWAVSMLAAREPLDHAPGTRSVYSDLGFILLGWLLERLSGARLDLLFAREIAAPLGLAATAYLTLTDADAAARARRLGAQTIAATQDCPERRRVLLGEVDDLNAMAMGGVAGHAGLFSTAGDLSALAATLCRIWRGDTAGAIVDRDVLRLFWSPAGVPESTWRLGWDGPAPSGSQAGTLLPHSAVGHLGFTGCSLWIDPARETWIVLLTNRVNPRVPADDRFRRFRPALHDAVMEALAD
jgi:CubicO group peptidase (beta-lactamase class C family)